MNNNNQTENKLNTIKKQLWLCCNNCESFYKLLEEHTLTKLNGNNTCLDNCLAKWGEILADHYRKELADYLNNKEEEDYDEEWKS